MTRPSQRARKVLDRLERNGRWVFAGGLVASSAAALPGKIVIQVIPFGSRP